MRFFFLILSVFFLSSKLTGADETHSVVKIRQTCNSNNYYSPWNAPYQKSGIGSGFIIDRGRILTNAHVVADSAFIQVEFSPSAKKYRGYVEWIGHDCDLAIVSVKDQEFCDLSIPLELSDELPQVRDELMVLGYPMGGRELSVTKGILSRTEMRRYSHGGKRLMDSQIDAPINPGNSGGPVISKGKVVGVVHQGITKGQNLGYMIPLPVVKHFLSEVDSSKYEGFPSFGIRIQSMDNEALRKYYQMGPEDTGVLITEVYETSSCYGHLFPGDVILSVDGVKVENNGQISLGEGHWIFFSYLLSSKYYGETIEGEVLRNGVKTPVAIPLNPQLKSNFLVRDFEHEKRPTYYVKGGLVFQPVTQNYLSYFEDNIPLTIQLYETKGAKRDGQQELVVISRVLPDEMNEGYQMLAHEIVTEINEMPIHCMEDVVRAFEKNPSAFHVISTESDLKVVLSAELVKERDPEIWKQYFIQADRSADLDSTRK